MTFSLSHTHHACCIIASTNYLAPGHDVLSFPSVFLSQTELFSPSSSSQIIADIAVPTMSETMFYDNRKRRVKLQLSVFQSLRLYR